MPLWALFERIKDVGHPDEQMLSVYRDHGVVVKDGRVDNFNKTAENRNIYQLIEPGWLVVNRMKAWQGSLGISPHRGIVSGHYLCFRPHHSEDPRFLNYLLRSRGYAVALRRLSRGVRPSQIEIDNDGLRVLPLSLPDLRTQRAISDYLDTETTRIDALIAKKRRLVAVIEERRRAAMLHAIDGLAAPLVPLKRVARLIDCKHRTPTYVDVGYPVVSPGDVEAGPLDLSRCHRFVGQEDWLDLADGDRRPRRGDIIYSRNASVGLAGLVTKEDPFCMGQDVCIVRALRSDGDGRFLSHVLNTWGLRQIDAIKVGSTFFRINVAQISELVVPAVPAEMQDALVGRWEVEAMWAQRMGQRLTDQMRLLSEHRQTLITAAVTGGLDLVGAAA